ncbi:hypothetical protein PCANC_00125 [Puccinia coronata f. sp. avenae]|uniref:Uncharacterized protein n=1 Tax=Puccinia coronata f. sp. avenae TaxID=200324 RepID=A0A2N5W8L1_9BASI|nr:hypothetical protein PCANC_00125 [Puccinia coronata f. sp. avenae]
MELRKAEGIELRANQPTGSPMMPPTCSSMRHHSDSFTSNPPSKNAAKRLDADNILDGTKTESSTSSPHVEGC